MGESRKRLVRLVGILNDLVWRSEMFNTGAADTLR